jgi:hypothetical protein
LHPTDKQVKEGGIEKKNAMRGSKCVPDRRLRPLNNTHSSSREADTFLCCSLVPVAVSPPPRGALSSCGVPLLVYRALPTVSSRCFGASARCWHACALLQTVGHLKWEFESCGHLLVVWVGCIRRVRVGSGVENCRIQHNSRRRRRRRSENGLEGVPQVCDVEVCRREFR